MCTGIGEAGEGVERSWGCWLRVEKAFGRLAEGWRGLEKVS